jgi:recombination associated protein RdgC
MSLAKGTMTLRRFVAEGGTADVSARTLVELLAKHAFRGSLEDPRKEERSGWVTLQSLLATTFDIEETYVAPYLLFALRTDRKAIPPALLRALVDQDVAQFLKDTGLERLPPGMKTEIKERIEEKYLPRILPTVAVVEVCWNLGTDVVMVMASSDKAIGRVAKQFSATFSRALREVTPPRLALRGPAADDRVRALSVSAATDLVDGDGVVLRRGEA